MCFLEKQLLLLKQKLLIYFPDSKFRAFTLICGSANNFRGDFFSFSFNNVSFSPHCFKGWGGWEEGGGMGKSVLGEKS